VGDFAELHAGLTAAIDREDTLSIRGMVAKIPHLVQILGE
jgi:hypothetical protein